MGLCLIGKIMVSRVANKGLLERVMNLAWNLSK